ncbi:MAG: hypothetical protein GY705_29225 [Bacteroidetes bacterium]|nr:hypothetical protein [Bacteroidota bacterium]
MKNIDKIQEELQALSPFLAKQKGMDSGFEVPSDYFSSLPNEVMQKWQVQKEQEQKSVEKTTNWMDTLIPIIQPVFQPRLAVAFAMVLLIIVAGVFFANKNSGTENEFFTFDAEAISDTELLAYIENNLEDFDETWLLSDDALEDIESDWGLFPASDLEEDELDQYIDNHIEELDLKIFEEVKRGKKK